MATGFNQWSFYSFSQFAVKLQWGLVAQPARIFGALWYKTGQIYSDLRYRACLKSGRNGFVWRLKKISQFPNPNGVGLTFGFFKQPEDFLVNLDHENFEDFWNYSDGVVHISALKTKNLAQTRLQKFKQGVSRRKNLESGSSRRGYRRSLWGDLIGVVWVHGGMDSGYCEVSVLYINR
jgi:hypothetical protein